MECPSLRDLPPPPAGKTGWPWTEESLRLSKNTSDGHPWPRVSIVSPSYNQNEFLEETIRSVLLQGYPDLEYIIMDGGSNDGSVDIIRKYEPWLTCWVSQPDPGQTYAINKGWEAATGQILAYINSDDYYLPGAIAAAAKGFYLNAHAGMVYGTAIVVDRTGGLLRVWQARTFHLKTMLTVGSVVPQPSTFFARPALESMGYLNQQWHMIMDYELCVRIGVQYPVVCLPVALAKFRDHVRSKTHSNYEDLARELMDWLDVFVPADMTTGEWRAIRCMMISRIYYEWAVNDLLEDHQYSGRALAHLVESFARYPLLAIKRPLDTAYLIKEICLSTVKRAHARLGPRHKPQPPAFRK